MIPQHIGHVVMRSWDQLQSHSSETLQHCAAIHTIFYALIASSVRMSLSPLPFPSDRILYRTSFNDKSSSTHPPPNEYCIPFEDTLQVHLFRQFPSYSFQYHIIPHPIRRHPSNPHPLFLIHPSDILPHLSWRHPPNSPHLYRLNPVPSGSIW